jgi:hypothetical protein
MMGGRRRLVKNALASVLRRIVRDPGFALQPK